MDRIKISDTIMDVCVKMSEGNPGALTCVMEMLRKDDWYKNAPGFMLVLNLDSIGVYGEKLYMLWSDCCGRDLNKLDLVLRNWQMGKLSKTDIHKNLSGGYGKPFENLVPFEELFIGS